MNSLFTTIAGREVQMTGTEYSFRREMCSLSHILPAPEKIRNCAKKLKQDFANATFDPHGAVKNPEKGVQIVLEAINNE